MENSEFGIKLIDVRKAKGLTQEEVARKCGITVRTIQRIEAGLVRPRAFTIKLISNSLGFDFFGNTNDNVIAKQELKIDTYLWQVMDLFNLKTNTMKKISILSMTTMVVVLILFAFNLQTFSQNPDTKNSITIQRNADMSIKRIEVRFTNQLTFDSLITIKNELKPFEINIDYKKVEFDDDNYLKSIALNALTKFGKGGLNVPLIDSTSVFGLFVDYSEAKPNFCIGGCGL